MNKSENPQFPPNIKEGEKYFITQGYNQNVNNYASGHHGGIDVVPFNLKTNKPYPAKTFPIFSGKTLSVSNTDKDRGKGIRVRTQLWDDIIKYLREKGFTEKYNDNIYLDCLYWHMLEVTDLDGQIDQNTSIGLCGNTGLVYSAGQKVPDSKKGVPPYPGLHWHIEISLHYITPQKTEILNLDKDPWGRIDPMLIINYKPKMVKKYIINDNGKLGILITEGETMSGAFASNMEDFKKLKEALNVPNNVTVLEFPKNK